MAHRPGERHTPFVRTVARALGTIGATAIAAAVVLLLLPLHGSGLTGNALRPHYGSFEFGVATEQPLPVHPTRAQMRSAGVVFPQDVVNDRRHLCEAVALGGAVLLGCAWLARRARARAGGAAEGFA